MSVNKINKHYCNSMEELINSEDFTKAFKIILDKTLPLIDKKIFIGMNIDSNYFLEILKQIQNKDYENYSWQDWQDFKKLINNKIFERVAQEVYNKTTWFTLEEAKQFLELYPLEKIKKELTEINEVLYQAFIQWYDFAKWDEDGWWFYYDEED